MQPFYLNCSRCDNKSPFVTHRSRPYWFCEKCIDKNEISFEGQLIKVDSKAEIKPGDLYLARRNQGWKLLTCKINNKKEGYIIPEENAYPYDTFECLKIIDL